VAILGARGARFQIPGTGLKRGARSSALGCPSRAPMSRPAKYRQASSASRAPWVVRELSAAYAMASCGSRAKNRGTGASRMSEPLPAARASVDPG
jgi:hypothetical protein